MANNESSTNLTNVGSTTKMFSGHDAFLDTVSKDIFERTINQQDIKIVRDAIEDMMQYYMLVMNYKTGPAFIIKEREERALGQRHAFLKELTSYVYSRTYGFPGRKSVQDEYNHLKNYLNLHVPL